MAGDLVIGVAQVNKVEKQTTTDDSGNSSSLNTVATCPTCATSQLYIVIPHSSVTTAINYVQARPNHTEYVNMEKKYKWGSTLSHKKV